MGLVSELAVRLRTLLFRRREERELAEELAFHLEMAAAENERRGLSPAEARRRARLALGGVDGVSEDVRDAWGTRALDDLWRDVRYALRQVRTNKAFAVSVLLLLALGIGANAATFSVVDGLLLRPLPVPHPERLVTIGSTTRTGGWSRGSAPRTDLASYPEYRDLRAASGRVLAGLYASGTPGPLNVRVAAAVPAGGAVSGSGGAVVGPAGASQGSGGEEHARGRLVSGSYFSVLRIRPILGRVFTAVGDRAPGADPVVVISHDYWRRRFAGDPSVVGRTLIVNGTPLTIIGVAPRGFTGDIVGDPTDLWIPLTMQASVMPHHDWLRDRDVDWLMLMGRLSPGATFAEARAVLPAAVGRILLAHVTASQAAAVRRELRDGPVLVGHGAGGFSHAREVYGPSLLTLMVAVAVVLLLVCINIGNLMLARASVRAREMSMRMALGAGRLRLVRQLLTESLLLAGTGGVLGLLLSRWGATALLRLGGGLALRPALDGRVLAFVAVASLAAALLFGLLPGLRATRMQVATSLRAGGRGVAGAAATVGQPRLGRWLVAAQIVLSLSLLVGTGMLVRSVQRLQSADVGVARDHLVIAGVDDGSSGYSAARLLPLLSELGRRLRELPGVSAVSWSENGLFSGNESTMSIGVPGFAARSAGDSLVSWDAVGPGYFHAVGARLLLGRGFTVGDSPGAAAVVVVNETMARFFFGAANPLGRRITLDTTSYSIVGVIRDIKQGSVRAAPVRRFYAPMAQVPGDGDPYRYFEVRTSSDPARLVDPVRRVLRADARLTVLDVRPLTRLIGRSIRQERMVSETVTLFGAVALLLAALGLYGVMAYTTSRRTAEFGVRMALGARPGDVRRMVLREVLGLVAIGMAAGAPAALLTARLLRSQLFGIGVIDLPSLVLAATVLTAAAALAGYLPAWRAGRVPPALALRLE